MKNEINIHYHIHSYKQDDSVDWYVAELERWVEREENLIGVSIHSKQNLY
jgi:hypothetical protein